MTELPFCRLGLLAAATMLALGCGVVDRVSERIEAAEADLGAHVVVEDGNGAVVMPGTPAEVRIDDPENPAFGAAVILDAMALPDDVDEAILSIAVTEPTAQLPPGARLAGPAVVVRLVDSATKAEVPPATAALLELPVHETAPTASAAEGVATFVGRLAAGGWVVVPPVPRGNRRTVVGASPRLGVFAAVVSDVTARRDTTDLDR